LRTLVSKSVGTIILKLHKSVWMSISSFRKSASHKIQPTLYHVTAIFVNKNNPASLEPELSFLYNAVTCVCLKKSSSFFL